MDNKNIYREEFRRIETFVKFANICKALGINYSNFASFKAGNDKKVSIKNLQRIQEFVQNNYKELEGINNEHNQ